MHQQMTLDLVDYHKHMQGENVFFALCSLPSNPISAVFIMRACHVWEVWQEQGRLCPAPSWGWVAPPESPTGSNGSWCWVLDFCSLMKEKWKFLHLL